MDEERERRGRELGKRRCRNEVISVAVLTAGLLAATAVYKGLGPWGAVAGAIAGFTAAYFLRIC